MNKKRFTLLFLLLVLAKMGQAQSLAGEWSGDVTQTGKPGTFRYTLSLAQDGQQVFGTATSSNEDGTGAAKFEVGGKFDGQLLILQEVKQLEPENARWCLKHMRLQFAEKQGVATLEGDWEAQGCKPGTMKLVLSSSVGSLQPTPNQPPITHPPILNSPFSILHSQFPARFSGHLSQSDRDYGFYFEMKLETDGTGASQITSDGEGGNATHRFHWTFNEAKQRLDFEETDIVEESVPSWRWCMKSGSLLFQKEKNRLSLAGDWQGYIEGHTPKTGACAPGRLYVEQPILFQSETTATPKPGEPAKPDPTEITAYETKTKREVDVERVLEVRNKTVRIRVWDNGTVDGDVLSLFLNGEQLIKNYRVTGQKHETIVKLDKPTNFIILHALNLGSISPNTVAVSVDDGFGEQVVIISSNLAKSGAVMIKEFTVK